MNDQLIEVELESMAYGGSALGHVGEQVVFIPYTIPGEIVSARITGQKGRTFFAEGVTLLESSSDRVFPRCPHFGPNKCGSCQWQHIDYRAQLLLKQDVLADQLERIGGFTNADVRPVIASPVQWAYNQHMTLYATGDGQLGFTSSSTQPSLFPINECHILHPELLDLKNSLDLEQMTGLQIITLQIDSLGDRMALLRMANDEAPELHSDMSMSMNMLTENDEPINLMGDLYATIQVGGRAFRVTAGSFFRPNVSQLDNLSAEVLQALALNGHEAVLDLYAGVGIYSAFLAQQARLVTLVDADPYAINDAEINLPEEHVEIIEGLVEDVLPELEDHYDAAVVDPGDTGLSAAVSDALVARRVARIVYVSSNPSTLARDGKRLATRGYQLRYAQPIDLAPQTFAVDTVAVFELQ
ncbi:MAG: methyltransferase [Anaerolineaceae bacterium]|nr:methyltransferase [Anaerolineaceae bacterium]